MNGFVVLGAVTGQKPHANAQRLHLNIPVARLACAMIAHFVATKESPNEENCGCVRTDDFLNAMSANAKACPSGYVSGRCAVAHHPVKHAKRSGMGGALIGAYHR
jgi:hypothetical protein